MPSPRVAVAKVAEPVYPTVAPFHPDCSYPEYRFGPACISRQPNAAYEGVREAFRLYGFDNAHIGTPQWNPLREIIRPGVRVVIKPNLVLHHNAAGWGLEPVVTHPSVLRAIADYAFLALGEGASLTIADAPQADCDFDVLAGWAQFDALQAFYRERGLQLNVVDLRKLRLNAGQASFIRSTDRVDQDGDPQGYATVNLGAKSLLEGLPHVERLYGSDYDRSKTVAHHSEGRHEYLISRTILSADVVIGVPKMKVHKKVGVTLNVKNLVGINGDKNYLPHFRIGSPAQGGDAYPDAVGPQAKRILTARTWLVDRLLTRHSRAGEFLYGMIARAYRTLRDLLRCRTPISVEAGNWYGNDTCWRMSADLNAILFFADADGQLRSTPQRRFLSVVDGIIGGELGGPLEPSPVPSGMITVGENPLAVDIAVTRLMGFDWRKVRQLAAIQFGEDGGVFSQHFRLDSVDALKICTSDPELATMMQHQRPVGVPYRPHPGWNGQIELNGGGNVPCGRTPHQVRGENHANRP